MSSDMPGLSGEAKPVNEDLIFDHNDYASSKSSKFRFKLGKRKSDHDNEDQHTSSRSDGHRHRRHHHKSKRKRSQPPDEPSLYDDTHLPNASSSNYLDPDATFRESLFDAMADDEGAQFWEGVYGQPIHKERPLKETPTGQLEQMTDDEYAAHVRAEMYKKTHAYMLEERARKEEVKKEQKRLAEEARREAQESDAFRRQVEESLRRGRERKLKIQRDSTWAQKWKDYEEAWMELVKRDRAGPARIPWPVLTGRKSDINKEEIETFFLNGPTSGKPDQVELSKTLKAERVRWHPDKIQQKLGGQGVDEAGMKTVTAVFQIIDLMWTEIRDNSSRK
jgi:hypothetical protein